MGRSNFDVIFGNEGVLKEVGDIPLIDKQYSNPDELLADRPDLRDIVIQVVQAASPRKLSMREIIEEINLILSQL